MSVDKKRIPEDERDDDDEKNNQNSPDEEAERIADKLRYVEQRLRELAGFEKRYKRTGH